MVGLDVCHGGKVCALRVEVGRPAKESSIN